jgi:hypothetical protein
VTSNPYAALAASVFVVGTLVAGCGTSERSTSEESSGADVEVGECDEEHACDAGEVCRSPEQHAWNRCDERTRVRCESGEVGDDCGNCFGSCLSDSDCGEGKRCNGAYCESPRRCFAE